MVAVTKPLSHDEKDIAKYFKYTGRPWFWMFILLITVFGIPLIPFIWNMGRPKIDDAGIDELWHEIARSREDEAYRVANFDKEDVLRDAQYFFAYSSSVAPHKDDLEKLGEDGRYRWNHSKLVYMIFGRDQLIVFDETICLENLWDGSDRTEEYYWADVSSVTFDERTDRMQIAVGPQIIRYPLTGGDPESEEEAEELSAYSEKAQEVANAVRMILRERKSSS